MKKTISAILTLAMLLSALSFTAAEETGLKFSTTDLNGNRVDESIMEGYRLVLFNLWEPWCGYCVMEMPELEKMYQQYKDEGVLIIGIVNRAAYAGYSPEETIQETGVTYPIINYCSAFDAYFTEGYFPGSLFIDANGQPISVKEYIGDDSPTEAFYGMLQDDTWEWLFETLVGQLGESSTRKKVIQAA